MKKIISTIPKNDHEELRVGLSEFTANEKMHQMVEARFYYLDGTVRKPGRNGLTMKVELLPALVEALAKAEAEAQAAGLLPQAT